MRAPTRSYAASANALPTPAPVSTVTSWPRWISSSAPAGVSATRYSSGLISLATPILTARDDTPPRRPAASAPAAPEAERGLRREQPRVRRSRECRRDRHRHGERRPRHRHAHPRQPSVADERAAHGNHAAELG